jgi:hypothetical protein
MRAPGPFGAFREAEPYLSYDRDVRITGNPVGGIPVCFPNPEIQMRRPKLLSPAQSKRAQKRFYIRAEFISKNQIPMQRADRIILIKGSEIFFVSSHQGDAAAIGDAC